MGDYDTEGPFKDYPQVTVYHPTEEGASPFANIGWPGSIGVLSGFNSHRMGISEIGASFPDDSFGQGTENTPPEKVRGEPWMFFCAMCLNTRHLWKMVLNTLKKLTAPAI